MIILGHHLSSARAGINVIRCRMSGVGNASALSLNAAELGRCLSPTGIKRHVINLIQD